MALSTAVSACSCVDSILKELEEEWWTSDLPYWAPEVSEQVELLKVELRFLKTFLRYIADWDDEDNDLQFGSLRIDIEAAIKAAEIGLDFATEVEYERRAMFVEPSISELQEKLQLFSPSIKEAYNDLTNHPFYSESSTINICLWRDFTKYLQQNLLDLCNGKVNLAVPMIEELKTLTENVKSLTSFVDNMVCLDYFHEHPLSMYLFTYFGSLVVHVAHLSYVCCVDGLDEYATQDIINMLVNVQKDFRPCRTEDVMILLKLIASSKSDVSVETDKLVCQFINFLVPLKNQFGTLFKQLKFLLIFFVDALDFYEENLKLLLVEIVSVFTNAGYISYLLHLDETTKDEAEETYLGLSLLLEKMELLNTEALIMELLDRKACSVVPLEDQIDSLNEGLRYLGTFHTDSAKARTGIANPLWMDIEAVAKEAGFLYHSFQAREVAEDEMADGLMQLLHKIRLFKAEAFLRKVLSNNHSLMIPSRKQIEILYEELIFFRTFLMSRLDDKGRLISPGVQSIAREAETFYYSFLGNQIAEEVVMKMSHLVPDMLEKTTAVKAEAREIYLQIRISARSNFPKTNRRGFLDFLLGSLKEMLNHGFDAIALAKDQFEFMYHDLVFFQSFLRNTTSQFREHTELKNLHLHIMDVAFETELVINSFVVRGGIFWYHWLWLSDLIEDIKLIKIKSSEISEGTSDRIPSVSQASSDVRPYASVALKGEEVIVGLTDQEELIMDRLTRGSLHREVVSIVGMGGIGKTTLAKKVYGNPNVAHHFHLHAWCSVSQEYRKRELLLAILSAIIENNENMLEMCDEDLELKLYKTLKGKRYLIVLDDMWKREAWEDMRLSFPNDKNGSRILITSRLCDLALKVKSDVEPHFVRPLSDDQSWKLIEMKLFREEGCPEELLEVGKEIAKNCKGLPLAVIAIAGLLERTNKNQGWWKQIAENLSSKIVDDPEMRCKDILELSYKHLPDCLKPCFLYLGVFLKDKEIQVRKLIMLWISEGFIQRGDQQSVEDAAEEYLMDLIHRSLLTVARRSSKGKVKACHIHDMLRAWCLAKCREENFLQLISGYDNLFNSPHDGLDYGVDNDDCYPSNAINYEEYRLSISSKRNHFVMANPSGPNVRTLLFFATRDMYPRCPYDISFVSYNFGLLRVLDLECINMGNSFPNAVTLMVHLRYLALSGDIDSIPSSIANLWNLETFLLKGLKGKVVLPCSIWSMGKLRHVHIDTIAVFTLPDDSTENSFLLHGLVTLSSPSLSFGYKTEKILRRFPNLRKLGGIFLEQRDNSGNVNRLPVLDFLEKLESLKILYHGRKCSPLKFDFPLNLKKLTLSSFRLPWDCTSEIGRLPNLEVLKLLSRAFEGDTWKMRNGEFKKLKFLKLDSLNISWWDASSDHLPILQKLVLRNCKQLVEVPSDFSEISTLEMIEVLLCGESVENSVRKLEEDQLDLGNEYLKVLINQKDWYSDHPRIH